MSIKPNRLAITFILASFTFLARSQSIIILNGIRLPEDTVVKKQLISSLNGFLSQKEQLNRENKFVLKEDLLETSALLDEMKKIEQNGKGEIVFKPYLTNIVKLDDNHFVIQFSYMGIMDNSPVLKASFKILAKKDESQFYFNAPLKQNTISWEIKKAGNITYHFKDTLYTAGVENYQKTVNFYDKKLNVTDMATSFYLCDNLPEVLQNMGVEYKEPYNSMKNGTMSAHENNMNLVVNGGSYYGSFFDPHDLWHERLRLVMNSAIINRPVDEGCAYLYGGSWGFTWQEIKEKFKKFANDNPNADWITLYTENKVFDGKEKPILVPYFLNALIVQKIEKEKGFPAVMELLGCGKREKGDENYFKALEKITGISKASFNSSMQDLINS